MVSNHLFLHANMRPFEAREIARARENGKSVARSMIFTGLKHLQQLHTYLYTHHHLPCAIFAFKYVDDMFSILKRSDKIYVRQYTME